MSLSGRGSGRLRVVTDRGPVGLAAAEHGEQRHIDTHRAGDPDSQRTDRRRLINHHQDRSPRPDIGEHPPQRGPAVGQRLVMYPPPGRVQCAHVMRGLPDIDPQNTA